MLQHLSNCLLCVGMLRLLPCLLYVQCRCVYQSFGFGWNGMASLVFDNSMCWWWSWQVKTADGQENDSRQTLPADVLALAQFTRSSTPAKRICYTTTRPSDMSTPYQKMIENGVDFGAPDKRSMKLINSLSVSDLLNCVFCSPFQEGCENFCLVRDTYVASPCMRVLGSISTTKVGFIRIQYFCMYCIVVCSLLPSWLAAGLQITLLYLALFAGLLGRFPLKLPQVFFSLLQCLVSHFFKFTMMCIWPSPLLFIH